jgi:FixJ family two-component response regulator
VKVSQLKAEHREMLLAILDGLSCKEIARQIGVSRVRIQVRGAGLIHGIAHCTQCDWSEEDYLRVQRRAAQHARTTGHKVTADLGYIVEYGG